MCLLASLLNPPRSREKGRFSRKGQGKNINFQEKVRENLCFLVKSQGICFQKVCINPVHVLIMSCTYFRVNPLQSLVFI